MTQDQLEALRQKKQLIPVGPELEGMPLAALPDNVYGFTYSPLNESTPLYKKRTFQSFEVHKLADGHVQLVVYVSAEQAGQIRTATEPMDVNVYPEPHGEATQLIELPLERIAKAKPASRQDGNYIPVHLDPA
jgi:hypothetical protein